MALRASNARYRIGTVTTRIQCCACIQCSLPVRTGTTCMAERVIGDGEGRTLACGVHQGRWQPGTFQSSPIGAVRPQRDSSTHMCRSHSVHNQAESQPILQIARCLPPACRLHLWRHEGNRGLGGRTTDEVCRSTREQRGRSGGGAAAAASGAATNAEEPRRSCGEEELQLGEGHYCVAEAGGRWLAVCCPISSATPHKHT